MLVNQRVVITKHKPDNYLVVHISLFTRKVCQLFCPKILIVFRLETLSLIKFSPLTRNVN